VSLHLAPTSNVVPLRANQPTPALTKKQLAKELNRSPRWIELRMREGLPAEPRQNPSEHARFDLQKVRAWLEQRAETRALTLEERVRQLEAQVASLLGDRKVV
jgi:hypothetical protein